MSRASTTRLGELKILRGELDEAEELARKGRRFCRRATSTSGTPSRRCAIWPAAIWPRARSTKATAKARETIDLSHEIGDKHYANMAGLVLAESYLQQGDVEECENALASIEETDPTVRFLCARQYPAHPRAGGARQTEDDELAVHHFSRGLTIFEAAEDLYHTGADAFSDRREPRRRATLPRAQTTSDVGARYFQEARRSRRISTHASERARTARRSATPSRAADGSDGRIRSSRSC